jgi:iron complex transport system ATP-binding protein
MLEARTITAGYGESVTIRDISFSVPDRKILAVVGPNGAGKTTLLKVLNRALGLNSGTIYLDGKDLRELSRVEIARRIAVVAQENETKFPTTVNEFILAGRFAHGSAFGWESPADIKIAAECLEICGLEKFAGRLMNELSGGERQRVLLARAFATQAQVLLLDEPTNNLDLANQVLMLKLVRERCSDCGSSAVIVTHDLNLATEFADEILVLNNGVCHGIGRPSAMFNEQLLEEVFGLKVLLDENPHSGKIRVTPVF